MCLRYLFALGGNAFSSGNLRSVSKFIVSLYLEGNEIVISHGNGPEVGELYLKEGRNLATLTGETERIMGNEIKKAILRVLNNAKVAVVPTKTLVSANDPEFRKPTKPIGKFYKSREAVQKGKRDFKVRKLKKGYRLVVPSPRPLKILETGEVEKLLSRGNIVIAAGGGGVAVTKSKNGIRLADAVIDKDLASSLLARKIMADSFFILTDVDGAYTDFESSKARLIRKAHLREMQRYLREGHFEEGSMKPKVEACIEFVAETKKAAAIGNISNIRKVVDLESTVVLP